jgi:hypothetical protein
MSSPSLKIPLLYTDIILVDFVGFSTLDDTGQYVAMSVVSRIMGNVLDKLARESFGKSLNMVIGWVPTWDGFYIILNPLATGSGVFAALGLRHVLMTRVNQTVGLKGVRCAVHHGPCVPFDDVTGKRNYIGSGLNDCARLLSLANSIRTTISSSSRSVPPTISSPPIPGTRSRATWTFPAGASRCVSSSSTSTANPIRSTSSTFSATNRISWASRPASIPSIPPKRRRLGCSLSCVLKELALGVGSGWRR